MDNKPVMLIVDDVDINRVMLAQFFQDEYRILEAGNGKEALELLDHEPVNIVLVDLVMPVMGGFEFMNAIKQSDQHAGLPVVAMTTKDDVDGEARAMEQGAADFITKPYNPIIVKCRIRNVMGRSENEWRRVAQMATDKQLAEISTYVDNDSLTGIYNREAFYRKTARLMKDNPDKKYEIIYLDVYCFKVINDLFNLETGNLVLKTAAYYFHVVTSEGGLCARIEADHFALCVPQGQLDIEELLEGIDSTIVSLGISHNIVFYAGIYQVDNPYLPVDQMCDRARLAMSKIKGNYMHRFGYYDESLRELMLEEQMLVRDMEFALQEHQFSIYVQPVYDAETGHIVSAEALVRWQHPTRGLISPGRFIPVFERNGFIVRLDRYVWEQVGQLMDKLRETTGQVLPVSVNVSRLNLYNIDLLDYLMGLVKKHQISPSHLHLEITETAYTKDPHQLVEEVEIFRNNGFLVSMDDFGSGYSSLNMLKDLPVDMLKVDMMFVRDMERSTRAERIMRGVVEMAQDLKMGVIVEGVETEKQLSMVRQMGVHHIQGYYYSKPISTEEFVELFAQDLKSRGKAE